MTSRAMTLWKRAGSAALVIAIPSTAVAWWLQQGPRGSAADVAARAALAAASAQRSDAAEPRRLQLRLAERVLLQAALDAAELAVAVVGLRGTGATELRESMGGIDLAECCTAPSVSRVDALRALVNAAPVPAPVVWIDASDSRVAADAVEFAAAAREAAASDGVRFVIHSDVVADAERAASEQLRVADAETTLATLTLTPVDVRAVAAALVAAVDGGGSDELNIADGGGGTAATVAAAAAATLVATWGGRSDDIRSAWCDADAAPEGGLAGVAGVCERAVHDEAVVLGRDLLRGGEEGTRLALALDSMHRLLDDRSPLPRHRRLNRCVEYTAFVHAMQLTRTSEGERGVVPPEYHLDFMTLRDLVPVAVTLAAKDIAAREAEERQTRGDSDAEGDVTAALLSARDGAIFAVVPQHPPLWCVTPLSLRAFRHIATGAAACVSANDLVELRSSAQLHQDRSHWEYDCASVRTQRARVAAMALAATADLVRRGADVNAVREVQLELNRLERQLEVWTAELRTRARTLDKLEEHDDVD